MHTVQRQPSRKKSVVDKIPVLNVQQGPFRRNLGRLQSELKRHSSVRVLSYIWVGVAFYRCVERKACTPAAAAAAQAGNATDCDCDAGKYLDNFGSACTTPWTFVGCIYFSIVTMSTVGFGDFSPSSDGSKLFTSLYALFGIVFAWVEITNTASFILTPLFKFMRVHLKVLLEKVVDSETELDLDNDGDDDLVVPRSATLFYCLNLAPVLLSVLATEIIFAIIYSRANHESYALALYHCWITALTIGYGDVPIESDAGKVAAGFHILVSVSLLGSMIAELDSLRTQYRGILKRYHTVTNKNNIKLLEQLNTNGDDGTVP